MTQSDFYTSDPKDIAQDAARYRWLRGGRAAKKIKAGMLTVYQWEDSQVAGELKGDALDAAVDAAIAAAMPDDPKIVSESVGLLR